jgi:conjugative relaxase-like TrwC/TraI family protein
VDRRGRGTVGIKGEVTREQFHALCENQNPETGERLTQRQLKEGQRRVFYDFTCSAPKSVSVLAVTLADERLVTAHEEATRIAFRELETFAATRVRKQGNQKDRITGNLAAAAFTHTSSRALDPQLHTHFTVFNATFDDSERSWKALQAGGMYDAIRYGTAVYRNELAKRVQQIGYRIQPSKHGFQIEGVSDEVLKRFSKRAQQRDAVVQETGTKAGAETFQQCHFSRSPSEPGGKNQRHLDGGSARTPTGAIVIPMNNNHCKNSARRFNPSGQSVSLNQKTKP